jgi:phosphatidylserine decarboxylase
VNSDSLIAKEGLPFIGIGAAATGAAFLVGWSAAGAIFLALTAFTVWFFRNPPRHVPEGDSLVVSPADGRVVQIEKIDEQRILKEERVRVSIFLNIFNVHINRVPCAGRVVDILYNPGKFFAASVPKASLENEQNALVLERPSGERILCVQIAGLIARRIVCWVKKGDRLQAGARFGLIRFGSRVDLYLPVETQLRVKVGDKVKGGETILGVFK